VAGAAPQAGAGQKRKLRVLNADDDETMRDAISITFKKAGHDVDSVPDGTKALELIAINPYDVVILDETMPGGSGFQVARAVSKVDEDSRPKVVIFTGQPVQTKLARETFLMSGADEVLSKDIGMAALLKRVHDLLGVADPE
jgi:DNA-binding response OmpR family regulator